MARLLYALEDHFDSIADRRNGHVGGGLCRFLSNFFACVGDIWQADVGVRRRGARLRGMFQVG